MPDDAPYESTKSFRQRIVASARLRGLSIDDICDLLENKGVVNPQTGQPWAKHTIKCDIKDIESSWRDHMLKDVAFHRSRILAELRETKTAAWRQGKLSLVLKAIGQEVDLLGLNELDRMGVEISLANLLKGFPKEIADQLKEILSKKVENKKGSF